MSCYKYLDQINFFVNVLLFFCYILFLVNSCHQSLLLYKNFKRVNLKSDDQINKYSCDYNKFAIASCIFGNQTNNGGEQTEETEIDLKFTRLIQTIMVPNLFALLTTVLIYFVIGLTSAFEAISVYCLFMCKKETFNILLHVRQISLWIFKI